MSDQKQTKENETMNAAQVLVRCLENEGVEYVFGIPGEENLEVMRALKDSKIKFITVRHELGAAFMADVYGKLKGKAGVCLATLGPGATNLVTGVADVPGSAEVSSQVKSSGPVTSGICFQCVP